MQAADYAEGNKDENENHIPPPAELSLYFRIQKFGASAVMDGVIPFRLLYRMAVLSNVYQAHASYKANENQLAAWSNAYPDYSEMIANVRELRKNGR